MYYINIGLLLLEITIIEYASESAMVGNFRYIPKEQKKLILTMSLHGMRMKEIENAMGIKSCTIRWLTSLWKSTGKVVKHPLERGRP